VLQYYLQIDVNYFARKILYRLSVQWNSCSIHCTFCVRHSIRFIPRTPITTLAYTQFVEYLKSINKYFINIQHYLCRIY